MSKGDEVGGGRAPRLGPNIAYPRNFFGSDITIPGSYFVQTPCEGEVITPICSDPGIGGRDTNFQNFIVMHEGAAVPEPATLGLLGAGLGSFLYRRRRQRRDAGAPWRP